MTKRTINIGVKSYDLVSDDDYLEAMGKDFEPHMVQLFKCLVRPGDIVADIGGNIGLTAILFSSSAKKVYTFEPSTSAFDILKTNLAYAKADNVEAINLGLGEKSEKATITFAKNNRSGGFVSKKIRPVENHVTEDIQIDSLDNYFFKNGINPNFIKIDVEGFEESVIKGGLDFIKRYKPVVTLELNHFCLNVLHRITVPDFLDFLCSVFPILYAVDNDNTSIVDLHNKEQAYSVMYHHLTSFRFPNIVGGFDPSLAVILKDLELSVRNV